MKCRKKDSKKQKFANTNKEKLIILFKYAEYGSRKSRFIKEQEASRLLSGLEIKTPLSQIPLVGPILF